MKTGAVTRDLSADEITYWGTPKRKRWEMLAKARDQAQKSLDELLAGCTLEDLRHRIHLLQGDPRVLIPGLAQQERIDSSVTSPVCRAGVPGCVVGTTAEKVLQHVDTSVPTEKPEGFATLVTA